MSAATAVRRTSTRHYMLVFRSSPFHAEPARREKLLTERRFDVAYETVQYWANKFGPTIGVSLRAQ